MNPRQLTVVLALMTTPILEAGLSTAQSIWVDLSAAIVHLRLLPQSKSGLHTIFPQNKSHLITLLSPQNPHRVEDQQVGVPLEVAQLLR